MNLFVNPLERRVVVTGMGAVCPLGRNKEELWKKLLNGETSIRNLSETHPWVQDYRIKLGSLFSSFELGPELGIERKAAKRMCLFSQLSLQAAYEAVHDSGILEYHPDQTKASTGVVIGVGIGGLQEMENQCEIKLLKGLANVSPFAIPMVIPDAAPGNIANYFGFTATECPSVSSSCASGASAIAMAHDKIKLGYANAMVCGGVGDANVPTIYAAFGNMRILSERNNDPEHACRPFDRLRDGIVLGDGAGILVLEELQQARARGARIYGELLSYGDSLDNHPFSPSKDGRALTRAINLALMRSKLLPGQIDYINAHGASMPLTDTVETTGIINALGDYAHRIPISSTKSMIGHVSGGSASLEAIATLLSMRDNVIHQTRNYQEKDPNCNLDYTPNQSREMPVNNALSNSIGFYGHVMTLCFGKI